MIPVTRREPLCFAGTPVPLGKTAELRLKVAETYRFRPAQNRDQIVPVWVTFPITFRVNP